MKNLPENIKKKIKSSNESKKIKVRLRKKDTDHYSIYLDLWKNGKREYIYPKRSICGTKESAKADNENLRYTFALRDKKEIDLLLDDTGFELKKRALSKADFIEYFKTLSKTKTGTTQKKWLSLHKHLTDFTNGKLSIEEIDVKFCESFYDYLNTLGSHSTPKVYYKVFIASLNRLQSDGVIIRNPAKIASGKPEMRKKLQQNKEKPREFLSIEEIRRLLETPISDIQIKNAFIFSCFTGLRNSDIRKLTFARFNEGYLYFRQHKTDEDERMKLHPKANEIVNEQRQIQNSSDNVFSLIDNKAVNKHITRWVKTAEIEKKISFHCARHSFATICLTNDIGIYTVQKLLGHKDIASTQIYAKLIDKKKDEAIDKLPIV